MTGCFRQVAAILDWAENRHDQPTSESDVRQNVVQAASMVPIRDVPTDVHAVAKTEGGKERPLFLVWKQRTARSPTVSGPKGKDESSKGRERTVSFEKWPDTDEEAMCRSIGSVSRHEKYNAVDDEMGERIDRRLTLVVLLVHCQCVLHLPLGSKS